MAFMQKLINLYQTETSVWDTNDETYFDDDKHLQALERIQKGLEYQYILLSF